MNISSLYTCLFLLTILISHLGNSQNAVSLTSSKLPICILNTNGKSIQDDPKITANLKIIYNGPGKLNSVSDKVYHYNNAVGIEKRGNSSQSLEQVQYGFETRDSITGNDLDTALLGMPTDHDWILYAPYNDVSMIRNVLAYHLWDKMDHWGPRTRMCELILNGSYQGVYVLLETVKRADKRIKINKLTDQDNAGLDITGGYIMKIDAPSNGEKRFDSKVQGLLKSVSGVESKGTVTWLYHYPKSEDITPQQEQYIHSFIDTVETVIQSANFADSINGYPKYISTSSFVDYLIHTELSKNADGYKRSAFFYKEKLEADGSKGKLKAGSVWDYNLAYGNVNYCGGNVVTGWLYQGCESQPTPALWGRLMQDPKFKNEVRCRYQELRKTILSEQYLNSFIDKYANDSLKEAQERHFAKYPKLFTGGPNEWWGGNWVETFRGYKVASYPAEIDTLKKWLKNRLTWIDNNLGGCNEAVGTNDATHQQNFTLYPNPTSGGIMIKSPFTIKNVEVYDSYGKKIQHVNTKSSDSQIMYDGLQLLQDGIYWLKFDVNGTPQYEKVIKVQ